METAPLKSGDRLPTHPNHTTGLRVTSYGRVHDDADGHELMSGLHRAEISMLKYHQGDLSHLYRYAIVDGHIFHTRRLVTVEVECVNAPAE